MKHASKFFSLLALTALVTFPAIAQNAGSQQENNTPQQQEKTHPQDANGNPTRTRKSVTGCLQKGEKTAPIPSRPTTAPRGCSKAAKLI